MSPPPRRMSARNLARRHQRLTRRRRRRGVGRLRVRRGLAGGAVEGLLYAALHLLVPPFRPHPPPLGGHRGAWWRSRTRAQRRHGRARLRLPARRLRSTMRPQPRPLRRQACAQPPGAPWLASSAWRAHRGRMALASRLRQSKVAALGAAAQSLDALGPAYLLVPLARTRPRQPCRQRSPPSRCRRSSCPRPSSHCPARCCHPPGRPGAWRWLAVS